MDSAMIDQEAHDFVAAIFDAAMATATETGEEQARPAWSPTSFSDCDAR